MGVRRSAQLLALCLVASCHDRVIEEHWPGTDLRRVVGRVEMVDGQRRTTKLWTFWYPDGVTKQAQGWYDGGLLPDFQELAGEATRLPLECRTKRWSFWDAAGVILAEGMFLEGLRDDLWACWKEDGELCCTGKFEAGRPTDYHATWSGTTRWDEHYYVEGVLDGVRVVRGPSGDVLWTGEYSRGELISSQPSGAPEPALHQLERCARAAEQGLRTTPADHLEASLGQE